jgi:hypothetical protein
MYCGCDIGTGFVRAQLSQGSSAGEWLIMFRMQRFVRLILCGLQRLWE